MSDDSPVLRVAIWRAVSSKRQAVKVSLSEQERLGREWASQNNGEVVAVFTVPGHSRREADVIDLFEDYAAHSIFAYHELRKMWKSKGFDVLHAYDDSRFGRSATLATYVMENTLLSGASIYYHDGGWLRHEGGFRYRIAVGSAEAAGSVDKMVDRSRFGKIDRAKNGLINGATPPLSHIVIRDPRSGKALRTEVDETKRRLFDDIADLLIAGVSWDRLGTELMQRGHLNERGNKYSSARLYATVLNPIFWGNQSVNHVHTENQNHNDRGLWAFDRHVPRPPYIDMFYDVHVPVYTGEQAEQVKQELRRRSTIIRGKARPGHTRFFTGLAVCGVCWRTMETTSVNRYYGLRCGQRFKRRIDDPCPNIKPISAKSVQHYFHVRIEKMLANEPVEDFTEFNDQQIINRQLRQITADIETLNTRVDTLMREQSLASVDEQADYRRLINEYSSQRKTLRTRYQELEYELEESAHNLEDVKRALESIQKFGGVDKFWEQEKHIINQTLFLLMCGRQLVVFEGEIQGTRPRRTWDRHPV
jgi:hypothetical protein